MRAFAITLGHFDFCVDQSGQHWFLECNGSGGQFQFAEKATGLPITDAIADLPWKGTPWHHRQRSTRSAPGTDALPSLAEQPLRSDFSGRAQRSGVISRDRQQLAR